MSQLCSIHHDFPVTLRTSEACVKWSESGHNGGKWSGVPGIRYWICGLQWPIRSRVITVFSACCVALALVSRVASLYHAGLILGLRPANEKLRYIVTTSLIGWAQAWNQSCHEQTHPKVNFASFDKIDINCHAPFFLVSAVVEICCWMLVPLMMGVSFPYLRSGCARWENGWMLMDRPSTRRSLGRTRTTPSPRKYGEFEAVKCFPWIRL